MNKVLWSTLLAAPAIFSAALFATVPAIAAEAQSSSEAQAKVTSVSDLLASVASPEVVSAVETAPAIEAPAQIAQVAAPVAAPAAAPSVDSLNQVIQYSNEGNSGLAQAGGLTIDRLSDVRPSDWAYTALQNLVEKYACIVGYPNLTYQGNRALTRYEFAAGLSSCLDRISDLIAASTADLATKEDLATLQRLQEEFAAELATLRGKVDSLEVRTAELEANQFSTTTKLKGETIFLVGVPIEEDDAFKDQTNFGYRVRLNFDTSFTGSDLLRARLQARNIDRYAGFGDLNWRIGGTAPGSSTDTPSNNVSISQLYYTFPVGSQVNITIAANGFTDTDWVPSTISPFESSGRGAVSSFGVPTPYRFVPGGTGAGATVRFTDRLSLAFSYSTPEGQRATPAAGLFNGDSTILTQLTYLSKSLDAALVYGNSYRSSGFTNAYSGAAVANTYGALFNFKFGKIQVGGNAAYTPVTALGLGSYDVWSYQGTIAITDLAGRGNLLGLLAGVAPYDSNVLSGTPAAIPDDKNSFVSELFYRIRLSDNIAVTPSVIYIDSPGNNNTRDASIVGAIRTTFSF
jgi:Carbohydrate-selective porin, OprB family/S-layer homology domain